METQIAEFEAVTGCEDRDLAYEILSITSSLDVP